MVDKNSDRPEPENIEKDISIEPPKQNQDSDNSEEIFNPVKETVTEETKDTEGLDTTKEPVDTGRLKIGPALIGMGVRKIFKTNSHQEL